MANILANNVGLDLKKALFVAIPVIIVQFILGVAFISALLVQIAQGQVQASILGVAGVAIIGSLAIYVIAYYFVVSKNWKKATISTLWTILFAAILGVLFGLVGLSTSNLLVQYLVIYIGIYAVIRWRK